MFNLYFGIILISQHFLGNISVISRYLLVLFQRVSCITTKHNCVGDQNVSHNKQIGVAAMEDGDERQLSLPAFNRVRVTRSLVLCMFCRSLFVLLYFFFWPLCCLFFVDIQILITLWYLQALL